MDLTIEQTSLARALRVVARAVPARCSLPVLRSVLLHGAPGQLTLRATDFELGLVTVVAADVAVPGRVVVPARLLGEFIAQLPGGVVRLQRDETTRRLHVRCGRFTATLATVDAEEFPTFPADGADEGGTVLELDAAALRTAITRVAFAAARDDTRPVLRTVRVDCGPEGLTLAAADGFRLARAQVRAAPATGALPQQLLVPARALAECGRLLADAEAARLTVRPEARTLHLTVGPTTLFAHLAEGHFPNVEAVIPPRVRHLRHRRRGGLSAGRPCCRPVRRQRGHRRRSPGGARRGTGPAAAPRAA
jgi:DNA polymerase-3 subunit beta